MKVGVLGTGVMGKGLSILFALNGFDVIQIARTDQSIKELTDGYAKTIRREARIARFSINVDEVASRIKLTKDVNELVDIELLIEAIHEDFNAKIDLLSMVEKIVSSNTVIASNTSSLSINDLAISLVRPSKFVGLHFFNPPLMLELVEVIPSNQFDEEAHSKVLQFLSILNKKPVLVSDNPGFIVNRLLMPMINDAARLLEEGVGSASDIDNAMKMGAKHLMGPLELADLIGIDIVCDILNNIDLKTSGDSYKPASVLIEMRKQGRLGRKSGEGFYNY